jgi:hypothetical protein
VENREQSGSAKHRTGRTIRRKEGNAMIRTATTMAILGLTVATTGAVASAPASAGHPAERPAYSISIYQQGQEVAVAGDTLKLKGGVTPAAPGQKVRLQVKYRDHKRFQNLATGILSKNSKYKFKTDVETNRDRVYRVVMPNSASSTQVSDRLEVRIYQWVPLTRLGSGNGFTEGTASIGGQSYPDSIIRTSYSGPGDAIWYSPLDYRCVELEAVAGLTDESPAGSSAQLNIPPLSLTLTHGPVQPVNVDLGGRFSLDITSTMVSGGAAVLGSPKALCHDSQGFA